MLYRQNSFTHVCRSMIGLNKQLNVAPSFCVSVVHMFRSFSLWFDQAQWMSLTNSIPLFRHLLTAAYFDPDWWPFCQSLYKTTSVISDNLCNIITQFILFKLSLNFECDMPIKMWTCGLTAPSQHYSRDYTCYCKQVAPCALTLHAGHSSTRTRHRALS